MNPNKFLFITCVNNEHLYSICMHHVNSLAVPPNCSVEFLPIRGVRSIFDGYNQALSNDAKYKIYLHQDTFIVNRNFLFDILNIFVSDPKLGLLGMVGARMITTGGWWEGRGHVGKWIGPGNVYNNVGEIYTPFTPVQVVDGLLLATQYDLPWRGDLFQGFHFYDVSQSCEFRRHGYTIGVPRQDYPWCNHHGQNNMAAYHATKPIFLQHYRFMLNR